MAIKSKAGTLSGTPTVDTVTLTVAAGGNPVSYVAVRIRAGSGKASFSVATNGQTAATPTLDGDDLGHLDAVRPELPVEIGPSTTVQVKIIGSAALDYVVHAE